MWRSARSRAGGAGIAAALALMSVTAGCFNDCQRLCSSWYGYLQEVCGETVDATELNRCVADYRPLIIEIGDVDDCGVYLECVALVGTDDRLCLDNGGTDVASVCDAFLAEQEETR